MFDRYDNERTLWNLRYNICLQRFVIWNCDNLQLLVSLVAIKQLLIIIDNLFDPYCNNYSPQREKHDSTNIINHIIWLIPWPRTSDSEGMSHEFVVIIGWAHKNPSWAWIDSLIASYLNVKISFFILSIFSYKNDYLRRFYEIFSCLESWLFELMLNMNIRLVAKLQDLSIPEFSFLGGMNHIVWFQSILRMTQSPGGLWTFGNLEILKMLSVNSIWLAELSLSFDYIKDNICSTLSNTNPYSTFITFHEKF